LRGIARDADVFVIGNVVSRGNLLDGGDPRRRQALRLDRSGSTST
jgi:hypothetical protein